MYRVRAHVADRCRQALADLALDGQVPVHGVVSVWLLLGEIAQGTIGADSDASEVWKCSGRQVAGGQAQREGRGLGKLLVDYPGTRECVADPKTTTDRRLAAAGWIPSDADSRLEVAKRGVGQPGVRQVHRGSRKGLQYMERNVRLRGVGLHLITQAKV